MIDIVKRLRECVDVTNRAAIVTLETDFLCGAALEAADEIEMLRAAVGAAGAENERLRAALVRLRDCDWVVTPADRMDAVRKIAREALDN